MTDSAATSRHATSSSSSSSGSSRVVSHSRSHSRCGSAESNWPQSASSGLMAPRQRSKSLERGTRQRPRRAGLLASGQRRGVRLQRLVGQIGGHDGGGIRTAQHERPGSVIGAD
jgi:hypothetical protein